MPVLDLQHVRRQRISGQAVDEVALSLQKPLRRRLTVRPLEVISQAYKARIFLESINADEKMKHESKKKVKQTEKAGVQKKRK